MFVSSYVIDKRIVFEMIRFGWRASKKNRKILIGFWLESLDATTIHYNKRIPYSELIMLNERTNERKKAAHNHRSNILVFSVNGSKWNKITKSQQQQWCLASEAIHSMRSHPLRKREVKCGSCCCCYVFFFVINPSNCSLKIKMFRMLYFICGI